jgi:hypothetical protein
MKSTGFYLALLFAFPATSPVLAAPPKVTAPSLSVRYETIHKKRAGRYDISVRYPVFGGSSPVARLANDSLHTFARSSTTQFIQEAETDYANQGNMGVSNGYTLDLSPVISLARPDLISVFFARSTYHGGVHPNFEYVSHAFGIVNAKAKLLALADLFDVGKDPYATLSPVALPKLKARGASSVTSGEIKRLDKKTLRAWVVTPRAITLLFEPYAVASYAEGPYEIKIEFRELADAWDDKGPIRSLLEPSPSL